MIDGDDLAALELARTLYRRGEVSRARDILEILNARYPEVAEIDLSLGAALSHLGAFAPALVHFQRVGQAQPDNAEAHLKIGLCLCALERPAEALAAFAAGLRARSGDGRLSYHMIKTLIDMGDLDRALAFHEEACANLADIEFLPSLAAGLLPAVPRDTAELRRARDAYETAVSALKTVTGTVAEDRLLALPTHFAAAYQGRPSCVLQQTIAAFYARLCPSLAATPHRQRHRSGRLRVGFVSAHFYNHTIGKLMRGLIAGLDRSRFEVHVFSTREVSDEIGRFIADRCDAFGVVPRSLGATRATIAAAELDVLIYPDIGMEPFTYFLAFSRLAPVQCVSWGHPITSGIAALDYFISGADLETTDASRAQMQYSEKLVRLSVPPTFLYPVRASTPEIAPDMSFADGRNIYACVQNPMKIAPVMDRIFIEILRRDPAGVLVLVDFAPHLTRQLRTRLASAGPDCADRIHFLPHLDQNAFFAVLSSANVILDTFDFSGGISSAETLGLGKAIVTLPHRDLMAGRVTYAYYRQMGFADCIARDEDDYIAKAVRLGVDPQHRSAIEQMICARRDRLFLQDKGIREFETFMSDVTASAA